MHFEQLLGADQGLFIDELKLRFKSAIKLLKSLKIFNVTMSTEVKNRMHTVVDRLFPGFLDEKKSGILSFSESSLYLMEDRFSPRQIRRRKQPKLIEILHRYGTKKAEDTAKKLKGYADRVLGTPNEYIKHFSTFTDSACQPFQVFERQHRTIGT